MYKIGWFSTGRDEAARDLLTVVMDSIGQGEIDADIAFVFCSREPSEAEESDSFIKLVEGYHIPLICFSYQKYKAKQSAPATDRAGNLAPWRLDYDREVMDRLQGFKPDLSVLAGYMLITGPELCQRYDMINLHPAAPGGPVGTWQQVIWQLIENNAQETGVLMHLVIPDLDKGPPVTYCNFSIRGEPFDRCWEEIKERPVKEIQKKEGENNTLFKLIRQHGLAREFPLIVATTRAFSQGKVSISPDKRVVDVEGKPFKGYNLTSEINKQIRGTLT
ncbi:phosphoribosylglycinamide formyltransferase [Chloroflexota bacterium]